MGKNVLYKSNGEERYPNFKLYKMIARTVHEHTPEKQLDYAYFKQFRCKNLMKATKENKEDIMDLDVLFRGTPGNLRFQNTGINPGVP